MKIKKKKMEVVYFSEDSKQEQPLWSGKTEEGNIIRPIPQAFKKR